MDENFDLIYKTLLRRYYPSLIFYATRLVGEEKAENVIQDVLTEFWKRGDSIETGEQIQAPPYHATHTHTLNALRHRSVEDGYCTVMEEINRRHAEFYQPDNSEAIRKVEDQELWREIHDVINEPPDRYKEVFELSYLHDTKNKEIADVLGVLLHAVEAHMYKTSKFL